VGDLDWGKVGGTVGDVVGRIVGDIEDPSLFTTTLSTWDT